MDSYQNNTTQIEKKRNSVKDSVNPLQNNSPTDSLYSPEYWDMKWDTEGKNLVPIEHQYLLDDLYLYDDYDNVVGNEYEGQLSGKRQLERGCPEGDN